MPPSVGLPKVFKLLRLKKILVRECLHQFRCILGAWNVLMHKVVGNMRQRNQITELVRTLLVKLAFRAEHEVAAEVFVVLYNFTWHWQFLANAKVNECEFDLAFFRFPCANVFWFQIAVRVTKSVQNFQCCDTLAQHICRVVDSCLQDFGMFHPLLNITAAVCHQNLTALFIDLVPKHQRKAWEFATWINHLD